MVSKTKLSICESFYSIQGEGVSAGMPAVFLRLAGCNLRCEQFTYKDPQTGEHLGCDSKHLWRLGQLTVIDEIITAWHTAGWLAKLAQGAHLVITGGEPLLQQAALVNFIAAIDHHIIEPIFIEIETNGTLLFQAKLLDRINQVNVSPKLSHSGETLIKAYQPMVIEQLIASAKVVFKFVVAAPTDIEEILSCYVIPHGIKRQHVWLMPEGGTQDSINAKKAWLVELCKQNLFNFTSRLHIDIWNNVVGV